MRLLLILLLLVPLGMINAQTSYSPPESCDAVCFGGDIYAISLYAEVQIFFDKEKKYIYKVIARLDHPKLDMMNKFVFIFPKY